MERERIRIGGWGLVEGFALTYPNPDFNIHISEGLLINEQGKEVYVDKYIMYCDEPDYETLTEEVVVNEEGYIKLKYPPYSPSRFGLINYNPPNDALKPLAAELKIVECEMPSIKMVPLSVIGNTITVSASDHAGQIAKVTYYYCNDRIDEIMLDKEGLSHREIGLLSISPSKTDLALTKMSYRLWKGKKTRGELTCKIIDRNCAEYLY